MRGVRRSGSLGSSGQGSRTGVGSTDSYILDKLLLPRLEQYAQNNSISNIDNTVEYLRRNYQEYRRKQQGPFRKIVTRAVQIIKRRVLPEESAEEENIVEEELPEVPARDLGKCALVELRFSFDISYVRMQNLPAQKFSRGYRVPDMDESLFYELAGGVFVNRIP
ncbi:hypothetical protein AXG93_312s1040 [Marchantia polymorpha subsp. ruderalis]|uniref:NVL2 nucleolin binding domain-containing protein n=1 Tax=Marchantia polymorpha subsp. ruderalis TaxID=1480154 RepID=A0A176W8E4_MARPO|nr:hypothetical protein AXG93_312s1040 [Marchantia polymorpha subsp. ruderalis]